MNKTRRSTEALLWILFMLASAITITQTKIVSGQTVPKFYTDPWASYANQGQNFNVSINIMLANDLYGWATSMSWDTKILNMSSATEGPFLPTGGSTNFNYNLDTVTGEVKLVGNLTGDVPGINGNGTLAIVCFMVLQQGKSLLNLYDTKIIDSTGALLSHTSEDGFYTTTTMYLKPKASYAEVGQNFTVDVMVFDVSNLFGWQFYMTYNQTIIDVNNVTEGDFLYHEQGTYFVWRKLSEGLIVAACTRLSKGYTFVRGADGTGKLATIEFTTKSLGSSWLNFTGDRKKEMRDSTGAYEGAPIAHHVENGLFANTALPPIASFSYTPNRPLIGEEITFDASTSRDPDGEILSYAWDFGDGSTVTETAPIVTYNYTQGGLYTVALTVKDNVEMTATKEEGVRVRFVHDSTVVSVTASQVEVTTGETVTISVVIENIGTSTETVDVTAAYDGTAIETQTATDLAPDAKRTLTFNWATGNVAPGTYRIKATTKPVDGETSTTDNEKLGATVTVKSTTSFPLVYVLGGAAVALIGVVAGIYFIRRRRTV